MVIVQAGALRADPGKFVIELRITAAVWQLAASNCLPGVAIVIFPQKLPLLLIESEMKCE